MEEFLSAIERHQKAASLLLLALFIICISISDRK